MAISFAIPTSPTRSINTLANFQGCDLTNDETVMQLYHSPQCENFVRWYPGKLRKSLGYKIKNCEYSNVGVNVANCLASIELGEGGDEVKTWKSSGLDRYEYNFGGRLDIYKNLIVLYDENGNFCTSEVFLTTTDFSVIDDDGIIFISDDSKNVEVFVPYRVYNTGSNTITGYGLFNFMPSMTDRTTISDIEKLGFKTPLFTIAKSPTGGGTPYDDVNLLFPYVEETYLGTATNLTYNTSLDISNSEVVYVKKLNSDGNWSTISSSGYTVGANSVTFSTAPGVSPITGQDNVKIKYRISITSICANAMYAFCSSYGKTLMFSNGNKLRFSDSGNGYFIPETNYTMLGDSTSKIVGMATLNGNLVAFKDGDENEKNIYIGNINQITEDNALKLVFQISNSIISYGCLGWQTIQSANNEILYCTPKGLYAITTADINSEKVSELRSYFFNGYADGKTYNRTYSTSLCKSTVYDNYYILSMGDRLILFDLIQPITTDPSSPYSQKQYATFVRTLPNFTVSGRTREVSSLNVVYGKLVMGDTKGVFYEFNTEVHNVKEYHDEGLSVCNKDLIKKSLYQTKNGETKNGITVTWKNYNEVTFDGTATSDRTSFEYYPSTSRITLQPGTYIITLEGEDNEILLDMTADGVTYYHKNVPFTLETEKSLTLYYYLYNGQTYNNQTVKAKLEKIGDNSAFEKGEDVAIHCIYTTPDLAGQLFYKNKTLRYIAARFGESMRSSCIMSALDRGQWEEIKRDESTGMFFNFADLNFTRFTFNTDHTSYISRTKARVKKVDKFRIKLENDCLNENMFFLDLGLEFVEQGNFKG